MKPDLRPVSADEARRLLSGAVAVVGAETVPLERAAGRVLATPLVAGEDAPAFPRSAMDGYAVRAADTAGATDATPVRLAVVGEVLIGSAPATVVGAGQAVAIPTGGHLPDGADAVVMVEHVSAAAGAIEVRRAVAAERNVVRAGQDIARGTELLPAGRRLAAADLAALAAFGQVQVSVHRRPRVAILSTGTELCPPTEFPAPGKVRDINQYALGAQVAATGCEVSRAGIVADDPAALERAVQALAADHDVVILSGGSSIGGRDHTAEIFARLGPLLFHGIACRPGRPTLVAHAGSALLVGLPGVPTAAFLIFEVFVAPTLRRLAGELAWSPVTRPARLLAAYTSEPGREDYLLVRLVEQSGETLAEVHRGGPSALSHLLAANGLVVVPAQVTALSPGDPVPVRPVR